MPKQGNNTYQRKDKRREGRCSNGMSNYKKQNLYAIGIVYEDAARNLEASEKTATSTGLPAMTFENISTEWLHLQQPALKPSSYSKYANLLRLYLNPRFGEMEIAEITRFEVQQFTRELLKTGGSAGIGLAPKTVNSAISILKNVLEYANREIGLQISDIKDISVREKKKPMQVFTRFEQSILSKHLWDNPNPCNIGILLCLYTGMRIGEICALRWGDIVFGEQYIFVHQAMQRIQIDGEGGKKTKIVIQQPKSECSIRQIPIPTELLQLLVSVKRQNETFILTGMVNSYIEPRCMENRFKSVITECGISKLNFHALRHTFATRCVELGFDIKSLSEILGHASVNITLNRYVHPSLDLKQANMDRLSVFFD